MRPRRTTLGQINNYLSGWLPKLAAQATSIKGPYLAQKAWSDRRGQYQAKWLKHFQGQAIHPTAIHLITTCFTLYCGKYGSWGKVRSNLVCNCLPTDTSHQAHETMMSLSHICSSLPPVAPHFCVFTEGLHWSHLGTSRRSCMIDAHNLHGSVHLRTSETHSWEGRYSPGLTLGFGRTCSVPLPTYRPWHQEWIHPHIQKTAVKGSNFCIQSGSSPTAIEEVLKSQLATGKVQPWGMYNLQHWPLSIQNQLCFKFRATGKRSWGKETVRWYQNPVFL